MRSEVRTLRPLHALRVLEPAGGALLEQLALYGQLVAIEWALEKRRLTQLLAAALQTFACLLCLLLAAGAAAIALCWSTPLRIPALLVVLALYMLGAVLAWRRLLVLSAQGEQSFAATRAELAADLALLRSRL
jgi:uncharacterized membrane protein YqjE